VRGSGRLLLHRWVWPLPRLLADLACAAFVAWEGVQGRYSAASHVSILAVIGVMLLSALVWGRGRQRKGSWTWVRDAFPALRAVFVAGRVRTAVVAGALVWAMLIVATIGWDATSFIEQRHDLPTLSRLFGDVTDHDWGRAVVFAAWLVVGVYLAFGSRVPLRGPSVGPGRPGGPPTKPHPGRPTTQAQEDGAE
jgi:hypothetical protein